MLYFFKQIINTVRKYNFKINQNISNLIYNSNFK